MDESRIDHVARALGAPAGRRTVTRRVGGALLGLVSFTSLPEAEVDASRRRKPARCKNGKRIGQLIVPTTGSQVFTPKLLARQPYTLIATGSGAASATHDMDAVAYYPRSNPAAYSLTYEGQRVGLSVNGRSPDAWGAYYELHQYYMGTTGKDKRISLQTTDPRPTDNSGSILVEIRCGDPSDVLS